MEDFSSGCLNIRRPPANILQTVMRQCHMGVKIPRIQFQITLFICLNMVIGTKLYLCKLKDSIQDSSLNSAITASTLLEPGIWAADNQILLSLAQSQISFTLYLPQYGDSVRGQTLPLGN